MKNIFLVFLISCFTLATTAQSDRSLEQGEWMVYGGVNAINSLGTKGPFNSPGDWAFKFPIMVGAETQISRLFSIDLTFSFNGYDSDSPIDGPLPNNDDLTYFSIDSSLKYYFGEFLLPNTEWLDFYANAGLGMFVLDNTNLSFNVGGGVIFWLNKSSFDSLGLKLQGLGKFAVDHKNDSKKYDNNHFQYSLALVYRFK